MRIVDLSHFISTSMPVYPGTETPRIEAATTIARDGFAEKLIRMYSHTGTHIDAPAHMLEGGATLDSLAASSFVGPLCLVDVSAAAGRRIELSELEAHAACIAKSDFVLLRSRWADRWGDSSYFEEYPVLSEDSAEWLAAQGLKGIGIDMISVDPIGSSGFTIHMRLFRQGLVIVENLRGLELLDDSGFVFACMPLRLKDADGSPIRAFAFQG